MRTPHRKTRAGLEPVTPNVSPFLTLYKSWNAQFLKSASKGITGGEAHYSSIINFAVPI
jgi:hypothetical protein